MPMSNVRFSRTAGVRTAFATRSWGYFPTDARSCTVLLYEQDEVRNEGLAQEKTLSEYYNGLPRPKPHKQSEGRTLGNPK